MDEAIAGLGGLHILINNGAIGLGSIRADHQQVPIGIEEIVPQIWARFVATNFSGAWNMTRTAIAHLLRQRYGRIINVSTSFATMLRGGSTPTARARPPSKRCRRGTRRSSRARGSP